MSEIHSINFYMYDKKVHYNYAMQGLLRSRSPIMNKFLKIIKDIKKNK